MPNESPILVFMTAVAERISVPVGPRSIDHPYSMTTVTLKLSHQRQWAPHRHPEHELIWGNSGGMLTVVADGITWEVPPSAGLWLPAGALHAVKAGPGTEFFCTYFRPEAHEAPSGVPGLFGVSALLREVLLHMHRRNMPDEARSRAERVAFDMLQPLEVAAVEVPMPTDPRALFVAEALVANPADQRSLSEWALTAGGSVRTLTRVFAQGTGMTFAQWRIQVRVRAALTYLAAGVPVSVVSRRVGYETPSAFVAVFRRVTGRTPGSMMNKRSVAPESVPYLLHA
ncbi:helix-turn-helix transcriptional regulator [Rhodococcus sp. D-46]|nr:helix-turn-helix domain-containing protein [Rhodococcus sp. Ni2]NHE67866.1 helix-turn-helix transcriptional regulator [Rhodococcus sp. D-46]